MGDVLIFEQTLTEVGVRFNFYYMRVNVFVIIKSNDFQVDNSELKIQLPFEGALSIFASIELLKENYKLSSTGLVWLSYDQEYLNKLQLLTYYTLYYIPHVQ